MHLSFPTLETPTIGEAIHQLMIATLHQNQYSIKIASLCQRLDRGRIIAECPSPNRASQKCLIPLVAGMAELPGMRVMS